MDNNIFGYARDRAGMTVVPPTVLLSLETRGRMCMLVYNLRKYCCQTNEWFFFLIVSSCCICCETPLAWFVFGLE